MTPRIVTGYDLIPLVLHEHYLSSTPGRLWLRRTQDARRYRSAHRIVATTDRERGALRTLATRKGYTSYVVPDDVGGRFSVLSPVGLFPLAVAGCDIRALLAGAVVTETVFSWPGIGLLTIEAIQTRDYPVVQACVLLISLTYVLVNLLTDLAYAWIDPRIRLGAAA